MTEHFVTTGWLADHLDDPRVAILDASWYLPVTGRNARAEYLSGHIPGARFFDIDAVADHTTDLPHMLPGPEAFAATVGAMGIGDGSTIVVYDEPGLASAPRVWWTFRVMGAGDVRILEGGGTAWRAEHRPLEAGEPPAVAPSRFNARFRPELVADLADLKANLTSREALVADARPADRFAGHAPEPRPGLRPGHIPGSVSVPTSLVTRDGRLRPKAELQAVFRSAGIGADRPVVASCGSGVTAATLALALEIAGIPNVAVYDGSWAEWGRDPGAPAEK